MPRPGSFQVVLNAGSGRRGARERADAIVSVLQSGGGRVALHPVASQRELARRAGEAVAAAVRDDGVVVAAGGDGTISAVAQAALGAPVRFGVVPQGTFNYFARTHRIPEDTEAASRLLLRGRERPAQVGLVNGRVFLVNAGLGLYPRLLADRERWKQAIGRSRLVALGAALDTLLRTDARHLLRLEHGTRSGVVRTSTLVVANNALQLEQVGVAARDALSEGRLVALTARPVRLAGRFRLLLRAALGRLDAAPEVDALAFERLTVRPGRGPARRLLRLSLDGEVGREAAPLHFSVAATPLRLIVPDDDHLPDDDRR